MTVSEDVQKLRTDLADEPDYLRERVMIPGVLTDYETG